MGYNPVNLALRLVLELAAVARAFRLGLWLADGVIGFVLAIVFSVVVVAAWGTFNVPGDRSRSGSAPIRVSGKVRLLVELLVLGLGIWSWFVTGPILLAQTFLAATVVHYAISWDRLAWLWRVGSDGVINGNGHR